MRETDRDTQHAIRAALSRGCSLRHTAQAVGVSKGTVMRYKRLLAAGYDIDMETRHQMVVTASAATIERVVRASVHTVDRVVYRSEATEGIVCSCGWWSGVTYDAQAAFARHERRPTAKAPSCSVFGCQRKRGAGSKCAQHFLGLA